MHKRLGETYCLGGGEVTLEAGKLGGSILGGVFMNFHLFNLSFLNTVLESTQA